MARSVVEKPAGVNQAKEPGSSALGRLKARLVRSYVRLRNSESSPRSLALGIGIGVFWGCIPLPGQTLLALASAWVFRGNKWAAAGATWVANPVSFAPLFAFNYLIGTRLLAWRGFSPPKELPKIGDFSFEGLATLGRGVAIPLFLGSVVVGLAGALIAFLLAYSLKKRLSRRP
ncbi:MAG: DUF2062 domain-containing protein [Spirochaetes bacterium]|nr:DUF2062 domain-containing protein [Spirochaetota bacterium]